MPQQTNPSAASAAGACELITFRVGEQEFAVSILDVREIRGWTKATPLPHAPAYVPGTINLRGDLLPIVDVPMRLGLTSTVATERKVIVVVQVDGQPLGLLVDAVSDVLTVADDQIQPPPQIARDAACRVVRGLLPFEDRMVSLLSLEHLFPEAMAEFA